MWPFIKKTLAFVLLGIAVAGISTLMSIMLKKGTDFNGFQKSEPLSNTLAGSYSVPYQVTIQFNGKHKCSGALIYKQYVLTEAHCVIEIMNDDTLKKKLKVFVGTRTVPGGTVYEVEKIICHPSYNPKNDKDDVAVLKLAKEVSTTPDVQPIPLPKKEQSPYEGLKLIASGYNLLGLRHTLPKRKYDQHIFHMQVVSSKTCQKFFDGLDLSGKFCAVADYGYLPCLSDYGSPATVDKEYLVGLWRSPYECNIDNKRAELFIDVSSYIGFIKSALD